MGLEKLNSTETNIEPYHGIVELGDRKNVASGSGIEGEKFPLRGFVEGSQRIGKGSKLPNEEGYLVHRVYIRTESGNIYAMRVGSDGAEYRNGKTGETGSLTGDETVEIGASLSFGDGRKTTKVVEMVAVSEDLESKTSLANASQRDDYLDPQVVSYKNEHRTSTIVGDFEKMRRK